MRTESVITTARKLAVGAHEGQMYDIEPYTFHLQQVVNILHRALEPAEVMAAGWLHDSLEDCPARISYADIRKSCGADVARWVYAVTDELGKSREERKAKTYPKTRADSAQAVTIKLADRIANVLYSLGDYEPLPAIGAVRNRNKVMMYVRESPGFYRGLGGIGNPLLWARLDTIMETAANVCGLTF